MIFVFPAALQHLSQNTKLPILSTLRPLWALFLLLINKSFGGPGICDLAPCLTGFMVYSWIRNR